VVGRGVDEGEEEDEARSKMRDVSWGELKDENSKAVRSLSSLRG